MYFCISVNWKSLNHEISREEKAWNQEIPTKKMLDLRNTHMKKFGTQEIPTRKRFRPTKYPQQKILDPRHSHD